MQLLFKYCLASTALILLFLLCITQASVAHGRPVRDRSKLIDVRKFANLSSAVSSPITEGKTIIIASPVMCDTLTVPESRRIAVAMGGFITIFPGKTLTVLGRFDAGKLPIIGGGGKVSFGAKSIKTIYPEWFGAKADGLKDSTKAIQQAIDSISKGAVSLSPGVYRIADAIKLLNRSDLIIVGHGSTVRQTNPAKELVHISGCKNVEIKHMTFYGVFETAGPQGTENTLRIDPNLPGTTRINTDISIEDVLFKHNGMNAIYMGGDTSTYGMLKNITVENCKMEKGLSFMLAVGVRNLTVKNIDIVHRNTPPVGYGISQDEDIAVVSANRVSCDTVKISNISIDARGSVDNKYTGHAKLDFMIAEQGLLFSNLSVDNVFIKDNLGNFSPTYGTDGSSLYVSDRNDDRNGFVNARFSNVKLVNSPGIFIEARNLSFENIVLEDFPGIAGWNQFGRAIDSTSSKSTGGCIFENIVISKWHSTPTIYTAEGGVLFNSLKVKDSFGSVWAASNSIYNDMVLDNLMDSNGAFYVPANSTNIIVSNSELINNKNIALKEDENYRSSGGQLINVIFRNNTVDTNINKKDWISSSKESTSLEEKTGHFRDTYRIIGNYSFWLDRFDRLQKRSNRPGVK